MDQIFYKLLL